MATKAQQRMRPHPTKAIFQAYKIQIAPIAKYLEVSYRHLSGVLSGNRNPSSALDRRIKELAKELELELGWQKQERQQTITSCIDPHRFIKRPLQKGPRYKNQIQPDRLEISVGV